ncbi:accessory factor UbiK family protein [Cellulophaga sp. Z1A5H]|uniref:accessory factor UbiK family protein n=1 Tax=Cellulophaga sp. Z1A5H TaxID=2687291 RepID=UPI0013FE0F13|nr:accessory factor UbiK family protein [Cellulophaga sp. Z1A5H]
MKNQKVITLLSLIILFQGTLHAQGIFDSAKEKVTNAIGKVSYKKLSKDPVSTNFEDTNTTVDLDDNFGDEITFSALCLQPRDTDNNYKLAPGYYEFEGMSFCLKAGTHGPSEGDGYLFAPVLGKKEAIVIAILKNYEAHPEIAQQEVQLLLWAIIAKTKFSKLSTPLKLTASKLLNAEQLLSLNKGIIGFVPESAVQKAISHAPPAIQTVIEIENKMRGMFESGLSTYEEFEALAILGGAAPVTNSEIKRGRWSLHPDGYYIRYFPSGYSKTRVQIYVPETIESVIYNGSDDIAVPANTGSQRLAQCNIPVKICDN